MTTTPVTPVRFDLSDILSAALVPGRKRPLHGKGGDIHCGDAILIDPGRRLIAVADGPERNPAASSSFLTRFHDAVAASDPLAGQDLPIEETLDALTTLTNDLMKTVDYHDSTTFSALIATGGPASPQAIILHAGDSLIFRVDGEDGRVAQVSRTSHVLVGRSPALYQTECLSLAQTDIVILGSDGLTDLARTHALGPGELLARLIAFRSPKALVDAIVEAAAAAHVRLDDISIVGAAAGRLAQAPSRPSEERIILT
jgi:serine/threonine protein phosphatase PrpC